MKKDKMNDKEMDYILTKFINKSPRCRTCHFLHHNDDIGYYCFFASQCYQAYSYRHYMPKEET